MTKDIGKAAIAAVTGARGMEIAGAVDNRCVGEDAGIVLPISYFVSLLLDLGDR